MSLTSKWVWGFCYALICARLPDTEERSMADACTEKRLHGPERTVNFRVFKKVTAIQKTRRIT